MNGRVDSFAILKEPTAFTTKPRPEKRVEESAIAEVARANNFTSRQPQKPAAPKRQQRRYRTGRNQHLGIKATEETVERFYKAAEARNNIQHGELLRLALDALERAGAAQS
jgi:hypothetical protein